MSLPEIFNLLENAFKKNLQYCALCSRENKILRCSSKLSELLNQLGNHTAWLWKVSANIEIKICSICEGNVRNALHVLRAIKFGIKLSNLIHYCRNDPRQLGLLKESHKKNKSTKHPMHRTVTFCSNEMNEIQNFMNLQVTETLVVSSVDVTQSYANTAENEDDCVVIIEENIEQGREKSLDTFIIDDDSNDTSSPVTTETTTHIKQKEVAMPRLVPIGQLTNPMRPAPINIFQASSTNPMQPAPVNIFQGSSNLSPRPESPPSILPDLPNFPNTPILDMLPHVSLDNIVPKICTNVANAIQMPGESFVLSGNGLPVLIQQQGIDMIALKRAEDDTYVAHPILNGTDGSRYVPSLNAKINNGQIEPLSNTQFVINTDSGPMQVNASPIGKTKNDALRKDALSDIATLTNQVNGTINQPYSLICNEMSNNKRVSIQNDCQTKKVKMNTAMNNSTHEPGRIFNNLLAPGQLNTSINVFNNHSNTLGNSHMNTTSKIIQRFDKIDNAISRTFNSRISDSNTSEQLMAVAPKRNSDNIDWEAQIPMDVITYVDTPVSSSRKSKKCPSDNVALGVISSVYSEKQRETASQIASRNLAAMFDAGGGSNIVSRVILD